MNAPEQNLFDTGVNTQQTIASDAGQLAKNLGSSLTTAPSLDPSTLTNQMTNWFNQYQSPIWKQQQSNLDSQLAAQGITQGSQAYNNAQNLQARNVGDASTNFFMQAEPAAYSQALQTYEAPIQTLGTLLGESQPGNVASSIANTPQESVAAPDYANLAEQNYQAQTQQYSDMLSGPFKVPSAVLGGWATSGFKGL